MANVNYLYLVVGQRKTNLNCISLYVNTKHIVACMYVVNNTIIWLQIPGFFESLFYPSCSFKYQTIMTASSVAVVECIDSPAWLCIPLLTGVACTGSYCIHNYGLAWAF